MTLSNESKKKNKSNSSSENSNFNLVARHSWPPSPICSIMLSDTEHKMSKNHSRSLSQSSLNNDSCLKLDTLLHLTTQIQTPSYYSPREKSVNFHFFTLSENCVLKIVIKDVPNDIPEKEVKLELEIRGFDIKTVKRFGVLNRAV